MSRSGVVPKIYDLDLDNLQSLLTSIGQPAYRAKQLWEGLYRHLWHRVEQFSPLPRSLQQQIANHFSLEGPGDVLTSLKSGAVFSSSDRETTKSVFHLSDGLAVEAVLMRYANRRTLCISTQAGCAMGCVFCATGQMGFKRNLSSGEIIEQVLYFARQLSEKGEQVTNVVVMGMGEPFHNYDATLEAIDRLNHPEGYNLGARRFTISTVGLVPAIHRFTKEHRQVNLAISLHAANDELRNRLLPINKKYPLEELFTACVEYVNATRRRVTFEWALINGVNDLPVHARELAERVKIFRLSGAAMCHVNIIQLNPTRNYSGQASTRQRAIDFQVEVEKYGIPCTIRLRRGIDIQAGCGQLATQATADN
jgi:23S rRNA (adenine2503-C2)-methyltransferase